MEKNPSFCYAFRLVLIHKNLRGQKGFAQSWRVSTLVNPPKVIFRYPSPFLHAKKSGWFYFILEPGTYYLGVRPNLDTEIGTDITNLDFSQNIFWFYVPRGNQVLYFGTLVTSCKTKWGLVNRLVNHCSKVHLINETAKAQAIAQTSLSTMFRSLSFNTIISLIWKPKLEM